ncbi:nucleotide sugar dehydrogenase [Metasolibacillus meyeri]|uniref:Nucleotide sugar dehydrogenase n=1 Tax=Metasolibacillus meyeri TaxID=1071052 RepID=A0AAW9NQB1_9BACL|nr:nucleotide sugar dehydrogenase [Metasolibacillus meyeri]MEC1176951.1 nucleotide sugar dehydrogenase [Metasolibacillus meyeri]
MNKKMSSKLLLLAEKIQTKQAVVGVIGLGYVGLPLALEAVKSGFVAIGFDKNRDKINSLNQKKSYISDLQSIIVQEALESERFIATDQFELLQQTDIIVICVPTPIAADKSPDISYIEEAVMKIQQYMTTDTLVILESTTYPGTTREIVYPMIEQCGYTVGNDCFLAYSPERIDPGNRHFNVKNTPKVVGGLTEDCTQLAKLFYEQALQTKVHCVSTPEVAEMEKLLENTFRQVNIALINELSKVCHAMNINIWEVVDAAATKPYGFMRFTPGPGVGGHCIPVDPKYLLWIGQQYGIHASLIDAADKVNESMPKFVVERLTYYLNMHHKQLVGAKIIVIGVTYKPNVNDIRESPALNIVQLLKGMHCDIQIVDPFIKDMPTVSLTPQLVQQADGVIILTNHSMIDYGIIDSHANFIFDTRQTDYAFNNENYYKL